MADTDKIARTTKILILAVIIIVIFGGLSDLIFNWQSGKTAKRAAKMADCSLDNTLILAEEIHNLYRDIGVAKIKICTNCNTCMKKLALVFINDGIQAGDRLEIISKSVQDDFFLKGKNIFFVAKKIQ